MSKKVFCRYCKFEGLKIDRIFYCNHPDNKKLVINYHGGRLEFEDTPDQINDKNNCHWYVEKFWSKVKSLFFKKPEER